MPIMKTKIKTIGEFIAVVALMSLAISVVTSFPVASAAILSDGDSFSAVDEATGGQRSLKGFAQTVINTALTYLGLLAVAMTMYFGGQYMFKDEKEGATKGLIYTGVGLVVILGSYVIVNAILGSAGGVTT